LARAGHVRGRFGIIIGVNVFMAWSAISTFPGMEVSSSYADSQTFDVRRDAQEALGWEASVGLEGDTLILTLVDETGARSTRRNSTRC
jgi:nitrogen fixation protein FixH